MVCDVVEDKQNKMELNKHNITNQPDTTEPEETPIIEPEPDGFRELIEIEACGISIKVASHCIDAFNLSTRAIEMFDHVKNSNGNKSKGNMYG